MKPQTVRLLDVFFIGPLMIYGGNRLHKAGDPWGLTLSVLGAATVVYNGRNYLIQREV